MFTGIVEELGEVVALDATASGAVVAVRGPWSPADARHGDSIAVNGVCLTVVDSRRRRFTADVMGETLRRSSLGALAARRPGQPGTRRDARHPAGRAPRAGPRRRRRRRSCRREPADQWEVVRFALPPELAPLRRGEGLHHRRRRVAHRHGGRPTSVHVGLIPTTLKLTTLGAKAVGEPVNLEVDVIAKYVEKMLGERR